MVTVGGKYSIRKNSILRCVMTSIMSDPTVWGGDATDFKPERCLLGNFSKLPENAWKPFGTGIRSCIGRDFAWQQAILCLALILQNFDLRMADSTYKLQVAQSLTIKPAGFKMFALPRGHIDVDNIEARLLGRVSLKPSHEIMSNKEAIGKVKPLAIFWAGNSGTSESLAHTLESQAASHGFEPSIQELDAATAKLPKDTPVIIITASYEGDPPDNGANFVTYLRGLGEGKALDGVCYTVFGNGNRKLITPPKGFSD